MRLLQQLTGLLIRSLRRIKADQWPFLGVSMAEMGRAWNCWVYADGIPVRIDDQVELKLSPMAFSGGSYRFDPKLTEEIHRLAVPGKAFLDAGAHVGICSLLYSALAGPGSRVAAFEPNPNILPLLYDNVRVSGRPIQVIPSALGDHEGDVSFFVNGRDPNASLSAEAPGKYFFWRGRSKPAMTEHHVPMTTIDMFCAANEFEPGLIKLDVEGAELPVLKGAQETLRRCRPVLILETHAFAWECFGYTGKDLEQFIREQGYILFTVTGAPFHGVLGTGPERDNNHYIVRPL